MPLLLSHLASLHIAGLLSLFSHLAPPQPSSTHHPTEEKKLKLKSPNFVVSDTRLSVRNVPHAWTEKQLKAAFIAAVSEGERGAC